jgi:carotenoid cleavage dioxygenase-like enzyme
MYDRSNPFLSGNYAPWREEGDERDLLVDGEIPKELDGALYRIGPNPHFPPLGRYHWFDGDGMIHAFILHAGRASYRNRYVQTAGLKEELKHGRALFGGLIDPTRDARAEMPFKNAANTNIIGYANRLLALWEAGLPHELKPFTLETAGTYDFCGKFAGPMTAHPKFDPKNGDLLFFGYQPFPPYVTWHRADAAGNLVESHPVDTGLPVMMHDFVTTDRYAIFFVCPSVFRMENMAAGKPMLQWEPQRGTRIGVMDRTAHTIKWFNTEAFYVFHFLNAYEEKDSIVVDSCKMAHLDMTGNRFGAAPLPYRFTLDLRDGSVRGSQFDEYTSEFPRFDERLAGSKHRYGYYGAAQPGTEGLGFDRLVKRDFDKGTTEVLSLGSHMHPGEPVFVPRSADAAEDDGYVMAVFYDEKEDRSELVIADARNFAGKPLARLKLQHRVPYGFHGNWVARS